MTSCFLGERTSVSFPSTFWGSSQSGRIEAFYAGRFGWMRALSRYAELKECPPRVLPFGLRTFISLCNLRRWAVRWCPSPSTLSQQSASLDSTPLRGSLSEPWTRNPVHRNSHAAVTSGQTAIRKYLDSSIDNGKSPYRR